MASGLDHDVAGAPDTGLSFASCHSRIASVDDRKAGTILAIQEKQFPVTFHHHPAAPSSALRCDARNRCGSCPSFAAR
jgi:hypothetical protein